MFDGKKTEREEDEEDMESYVFDRFPFNDQNRKQNDFIVVVVGRMIKQKIKKFEESQKGENILENKDDDNQFNEKEFHAFKRECEESMKTYVVDRGLEQAQNRMDVKQGNHNNNRWYHPNDDDMEEELVQAIVAVDRYAFQNMDREEWQFQQNLKKQKTKKSVSVIQNEKKVFH